MSRIGKLPISIPAGVTVAVSDENVITVKGPKGELSQKVDPSIAIVVEDATLTVKYADCETYAEATKQQHAYHGLYRALINNMVIGVSAGFRKELELVGVGYRVNDKPNNAIAQGRLYRLEIRALLPRADADRIRHRIYPQGQLFALLGKLPRRHALGFRELRGNTKKRQ